MISFKAPLWLKKEVLLNHEILTKYIQYSMVLYHIVASLQFEVGRSACDDLLMMKRRRSEVDPTLGDVLVRADNIVTSARSNIKRDEAGLENIEI